MPLTPLELQKTRIQKKLFGYHREEVDGLLQAVGEELARQADELDKMERENRYYRQRLQEAQAREGQLQQALAQIQQVSDQIRGNTERERELVLREARQKADEVVSRATAEAARVEGRIAELRTARRELYHRLRETLGWFERTLEERGRDEGEGATVHTLTRSRSSSGDPA